MEKGENREKTAVRRYGLAITLTTNVADVLFILKRGLGSLGINPYRLSTILQENFKCSTLARVRDTSRTAFLASSVKCSLMYSRVVASEKALSVK